MNDHVALVSPEGHFEVLALQFPDRFQVVGIGVDFQTGARHLRHSGAACQPDRNPGKDGFGNIVLWSPRFPPLVIRFPYPVPMPPRP